LGNKGRWEYLLAIYERYRKTGRKAKKVIKTWIRKKARLQRQLSKSRTTTCSLPRPFYELLADKGIVSKEEVVERVRKLKTETTVNFRRVQ
jgi:hypothetical protein